MNTTEAEESLSHYEKVGNRFPGNDIIQFHVGKGVAPDSIYDDAYFAQKYAERDEDFGTHTRDEPMGWLLRSLVLRLLWLWSLLLALPHVGLAQSLAIRLLYRLVRPMVRPLVRSMVLWLIAGWYGGWYDPWYYGWGGWLWPLVLGRSDDSGM